MGEKALKIAQKRIKQIITRCKPGLSDNQAMDLAIRVADNIDWENPTLMHKDLAWITKAFLDLEQTA